MSKGLPQTQNLSSAVPLWQIAPSKDKQGASITDFMLMIPRMRKRGEWFAKQTAEAICTACEEFDQQVVFADLNVRLGVIWVSVEAQPGLCAEVAHAIQQRVPEALLVGDQIAKKSREMSFSRRVIERVRKVFTLNQSLRLGQRRP